MIEFCLLHWQRETFSRWIGTSIGTFKIYSELNGHIEPLPLPRLDKYFMVHILTLFLQFLTQRCMMVSVPFIQSIRGNIGTWKDLWSVASGHHVLFTRTNQIIYSERITASNKLTCTLQTSSNRLPRINLAGVAGIPLRLLRNALRYTQVKSWGDWSYQHPFVIVILRL
jgi:hypothetical protein